MADNRENQFSPHKKGKEKLYFLGKGNFRMELENVGKDKTRTKEPNTRNQKPPPAVTGYSSSSDSTPGDGVLSLPGTRAPNLAASLPRGWLATTRRDRRVPAAAVPVPEASAITTAVSAGPADEQNPKNCEARVDKNRVISESSNKRNEGSNLDSPVDKKLKNVDVEVEGKGKAALEIQKNGEEKLKDERSRGSKSDQKKRKYDRRVSNESVIMHFKYDEEAGSEIIRVRNKKRSTKEVEPKAPPAAADQGNRPKCKVCGRSFASFQALGGHISRHNKGKSGEEGKAPASAVPRVEVSHESPKRVPWFDLNELPPVKGDDEGEGDQRS